MKAPSSVESVDAVRKLPVETVSIMVARLDDEIAVELTRLRDLRVLLHRGISCITDFGLTHVAQLGQLEALDLEWSSDITGFGVQTLGCLRHLKWLDLSFCARIRESEVEQLRRALPECSIER
jgi:hypothetical protein